MKFNIAILVLVYSPWAFSLDTQSNETLIVGHYEQWSIYSPDAHIQDLQLNRLTHLIYESAGLNEFSEVVSFDTIADFDKSPVDGKDQPFYSEFDGNFGKMIEAKQKHPQLRTLIAIGGWAKSKFFSRLAANEDTREKAAKSAVQFMQHYGFDGIDIDWQFPIQDKAILDSARPEDPDNYVKLIQAIRRHMDTLAIENEKQYFLTATMDQEHIPNVQAFTQAARSLDFINLHTSYIYGFWDKTTHHISPLYTPQDKPEIISTNSYVQALLDVGVAPEKMVLGVTPFGSGWQGMRIGDQNPLYKAAKEISWGTWDVQDTNSHFGIYSRTFLQELFVKNTKGITDYKEYWDDESKAAYLFSPTEHKGHFLSYESSRSLAEKLKYINKHQLRGIGIRQLHSDSKGSASLANEIFTSLYPFQGAWLKIVTTFHSIENEFLKVGSSIIGGLLVFICLWIGNKIRSERIKTIENKRYHSLSSNLQLLEWPLSRLYESRKLTDQKAHKLQVKKMLQLNKIIPKLLNPVSNILSETKLSQFERPADMQAISGLDFQTQLRIFLIETQPEDTINKNVNISNELIFHIDAIYFIKTITALYFWILQITHENEQICINSNTLSNQICKITITTNGETVRKPNRNDYIKLKEIYKISQKSNIEIQPFDSKAPGFHLYIPIAENFGSNKYIQWTRQKLQHENSTSKSISLTNTGQFELEALDYFEHTDSDTHNITKLIDHVCHFFVINIKQPIKLTVYQGETLLTELGDDVRPDETIKSDFQVGEFRFTIKAAEALSQNDKHYLGFLISQVRLVQRALKELINEPVLLSELNEIVTNKDQLYYLKSDGGYSALYFAGEKNPRYISMRLRTIKQYFDDDFLMQVHRSYLINPKKVTRAIRINKLKYELEIAGTRLPISRTYTETLKERYPRWFQA